MPKIAMIVGRGMGIPDNGEIWHMLDQRFGIPPTLIEFTTLHNRDLSAYNVIILANGSPTEPLSPAALPKLKEWVENGGTLITTGSAYKLTNKAKITDFKTLSQGKKKEKGEKKSGGFEVDLKADGGMMQMMGGFTVLRMTSMLGMVNVSFTKEELLKMNDQLNKIRKPKAKK